MTDDLAALRAESAIRRTIAAYCHSCDDGRFADYAALFAPDAVVSLGDTSIVGRDAIQAWITKGQPPERRGMHVTTNVELAVDGDRATGATDFLFLAHGGSGLTVSTAGRYDDVFVAVEGRWLFASRRISLLARPAD